MENLDLFTYCISYGSVNLEFSSISSSHWRQLWGSTLSEKFKPLLDDESKSATIQQYGYICKPQSKILYNIAFECGIFKNQF